MDVTSDEFLRCYQWRRLRMEALKKHGARCQCCGNDAKLGAVMHVDHIKARKTHPELALVLGNLQVLCDACNHGKGNWDSTDWRPGTGFFYNGESARKLAHIWTGSDTACHMWSSGGIARNKGQWQVFATADGKRICNQCQNNIHPG